MRRTSWNKIEVKAELQFGEKASLSGIYRIINKTNGRKYVGSAAHFRTRWYSHLLELRKNRHHNKFMQNDFNKCGEAAFLFEVLEVVEGDRALRESREQFYLDELFSKVEADLRYNHNAKAIITVKKAPTTRKYREDRYWFLAPDGKTECVIETLTRFCEQMELNRAELYRVINGEKEAYRGWRFLQTSMNNFVVNLSTGAEEKIESISAFAKAHELDQSHVSKLLAGKRKTCGDWTIKDRVFIQKPHKGKIYRLTDPSGQTIKFNNLELFAAEHQLDCAALHALVAGKQLVHKGWMPYGITSEMVAQKKHERYDCTAKDYVFIDPCGQEVKVHNITQFCKEHSLTKQNMLAVNKGNKKSHKGWKKPTSSYLPS